MIANPQAVYAQIWKAQFDLALGAFETITQATVRVCEVQLEAATQALADTEATRKALAATNDASQLMALQAAWARANLEKWLAYWRTLAEALNMAPVHPVYQQWLDSVQQLYKPFERAGRTRASG